MSNKTTTTQTIELKGVSGHGYTHWIHPLGTTFVDEPGNYAWSRQGADGRHTILYVGETQSLATRVTAAHEKFPCVQGKGVTHVLAHTNHGGRAARLTEESDIRNLHAPSCNDQ